MDPVVIDDRFYDKDFNNSLSVLLVYLHSYSPDYIQNSINVYTSQLNCVNSLMKI